MVSLHYASYGMVQFDLLRSRVLSAGILLLIFLAISSLEASRIYGLFGFCSPAGTLKQRGLFSSGSISAKQVMELESFVQALLVGSIMFTSLLGFEVRVRYLVILPLGAFEVLVILVIRKYFEKKPKSGGILACLSIVLGFIALVDMSGTWFAWVMWFWISGEMVVSVAGKVMNPAKIRDIKLYTFTFWCLAVVSGFAYFIYPKINPSLGGGAPVAVELRFGDKSPLDKSMSSRVWLVDESNNGFYILRGRYDRKAVFIPRGLITAVYYGQ